MISSSLVVGTILHVASWSATSLIENENQVWYHLFMFVLIITVLLKIQNDSMYDNYVCEKLISTSSSTLTLNKSNKFIYEAFLLLLIHRILKNYQDNIFDLLSIQNSKLYVSFISVIGECSFA